jgi:hypothetical protein
MGILPLTEGGGANVVLFYALYEGLAQRAAGALSRFIRGFNDPEGVKLL